MNKKFLSVLILVGILAVSLTSAGWFTNPRYSAPASTLSCVDADNPDGTVTEANQALVAYWVTTSTGSKYDKCSGSTVSFYDSTGKKVKGKSQIIEMTCANGALVERTLSATELTDGACVTEGSSAKWVTKTAACVKISDTMFKDQNGVVKVNGCGTGDNSKKLLTYSCSAKNEIVTATTDCSTTDGFGKCVAGACTGNCVETSDSGNDKDVAGSITYNKIVYSDACSSDKKSVTQYKCSNGNKIQIEAVLCGNDRECVSDSTGAGYCRDKYLGQDSIKTLTDRIVALEAEIAKIHTRLAALEGTQTQ